MTNRENGQQRSSVPVNHNETYNTAPARKIINGQLHEKKAIPFGKGFAYVPVEDMPAQPAGSSNLMSDRFMARISTPQEQVAVNSPIINSEFDEIELLERAIRGHSGEGEHLQARLDEARARQVQAEQQAQREADREALLQVLNGAAPYGSQPSGLVAGLTSTDAKNAEDSVVESVGYDVDQSVRKKMTRARKIGFTVAALTVAGAVISGGVVVSSKNPNELLSTFFSQGKSESNELKESLPIPSAALVDAFGGCLDENGAGVPLIELSVTSKTEVGYNYTSSKNTPKVLETNIHDENDKLIKARAKPVIIASNAPAAVTACVIEADRGSVVTVGGDTVTVDLSKISPQLYQGVVVGEVARGFAAADVVANPMADLWPVAAVIEGNVEAGKARPDTEEKMTQAIADSILKNYNDTANITAEIRQSQLKTAESLIRPGGGYAEKIKLFIKESIAAKIKAKTVELKQQGLTDVESPKIVFTSESKDIVEKNPEAPKVDSFKLADTTQITGFSIKSPENITDK